MWDHLFIYLFIFHNVGFAECGYPPMGDEVQAGSVLLPASRRGRYLANIVRRQAVDGTGIKFNKDADRMNAEAKKKVDVLSEELLPYIIAEQERRTTLYKRVMTAIQNGEKGVTIAEIRNKPPVIIRKGLMYRCPTNRAPREPDGSGVIMCEDNLKPTDIIFESCLSAEDKELFVAENKYFFCNRHKVEGPDLPRNGTTTIGCSPCERTPLNYTSQKCALEETDDVVVHYRYYPDRTYKFVSELDPEREVCDHWNPCQIGYIFSLPGPDQATPASELWQISREEDNNNETALLGVEYTTSTRRVRIPDGYRYDGIGKYMPNGQRSRVSQAQEKSFQENLLVLQTIVGFFVKITMIFRPLLSADVCTYYARFRSLAQARQGKGAFIHEPLLTISLGQTHLMPAQVVVMPAQQLNVTSVPYTCDQCALQGIMLRAADGSVRNLDFEKYRLRKTRDEKTVIMFDFGTVTARDFGDYFLIVRNDDGSEERIKALSFKVISVERLHTAATVGDPVDISTTYNCDKPSCELEDVLCHGVSVLGSGGVGHTASSKRIHINFPSFEDRNACVYVAIFKIGDEHYRKIIAILEKVDLGAKPLLVAPPTEGAHYERTINYKCMQPDCSLTNVTVNGFPLETMTRRSSVGSVAYFLPGEKSVTIGITEYSSLYEGVYQGVFALGADQVTKTLMEIGRETPEQHADSGDESETPEPENDVGASPESEVEGETTSGPDAEMETTTESAAEPEVETKAKSETEGETEATSETEGETEATSETEGETEATSETEGETEATSETEGETEATTETTEEEEPSRRKEGKKHLSPPGSHRSAADADKSVSVLTLRGAVAAGGAYHSTVRATPAAAMVAVRCRGANVSVGWRQADNDTLNVDFDHFEDSNACVYLGIFKIGQTEHRKTLAVLEMINVSAGAVVPPPVGGALNHTVVYTCNVTKCDPLMIYINDRTLRSDDKERFYSYKSEMVKGPDGEVMTVTVNFSIAPFTKEFEGVYQVVVSNGTKTVTKNIMEVGALV